MKKTLLAGVAVLLLGTGAAHAQPSCMKVVAPDDTDGSFGFVNYRAKPDPKSKIIGKLGLGSILLNTDDDTLQLSKKWGPF
jgi:hypothetical protein